MFAALKNHPFAVEAHFNTSLVITYAVPKEEIAHLLPPCLVPDTFNDKWAFVAVAMVDTTGLRPKGLPGFMGNSFFLIGYRIFVRYTNSEGRRLRGLYILRSETNKKKMELLGNIFTRYSYTTTDIQQLKHENKIEINSAGSGLHVEVETGSDETALPPHSPFANWKEARRFEGPLPFTFTFNAVTKEVLIIEGVRQNWTPQPVKIIDCDIPFIKTLNLNNAVLANAFIISNIPYHWKKGAIEKWNG